MIFLKKTDKKIARKIYKKTNAEWSARRIFEGRVAVSFGICAVLMFLCAARLIAVGNNEKYRESAMNTTSYSLYLYSARGTIYDCKMRPLTNRIYEKMCILLPNDEGLRGANLLLTGDELRNATERLLSGYPVTARLGDNPLPLGATMYYAPVRYYGSSACHILGYVDKSGGVSGIERGLDSYLAELSPVKALIPKTAKGEILSGLQITLSGGEAGKDVVLTIDSEIQQICERAMLDVKKGAVVVVEAESGKIRTLVSKPYFEGNNAENYILSSDSPLINRALTNYSVGSVFKPLVSAAAIEKGESLDTVYNCNGFLTAGGRNFGCHLENGHGNMTMKSAIAESCNVFFYNTMMKIGGAGVMDIARRCSFASKIDIGGGLFAPAGNLPTEESLKYSGNLCNLAIGQGELMLSPLTITNLYAAIANGGEYYSPYILEKDPESGENIASKPKSRVMDEKTAEVLKSYLINAQNEGTGRNAKPTANITAGGKTATVQTGIYKDGKEINNGWYVGFCEVSGKNYIISVLCEDVKSGATDCAPIFKEIADGIFEILG